MNSLLIGDKLVILYTLFLIKNILSVKLRKKNVGRCSISTSWAFKKGAFNSSFVKISTVKNSVQFGNK